MYWKAPTFPGYEIMPISVNFCSLSFHILCRNTKAKVDISYSVVGVVWGFFASSGVFFHMILVLFRGEIFTMWNTVCLCKMHGKSLIDFHEHKVIADSWEVYSKKNPKILNNHCQSVLDAYGWFSFLTINFSFPISCIFYFFLNLYYAWLTDIVTNWTDIKD